MLLAAPGPMPLLLVVKDETMLGSRARTLLSTYDRAIDVVRRAVEPIAQDVKLSPHDPLCMKGASEEFLFMLNDKLDSVCLSLEGVRDQLLDVTRSSIPITVMMTLLNTSAARAARLLVNLGTSDEPVWETFYVVATHDSAATFTMSCTSHRPPEYWQTKTTGSFSDPIGDFLPTMDPWVSTSNRAKRAADGTMHAVFTYTSYGGPASLLKLFEFMIEHYEFRAELVRTKHGPAMLVATGHGDGEVAFECRG